jgi:RNA polymerase sigma-70 factor (ECF subfamily)
MRGSEPAVDDSQLAARARGGDTAAFRYLKLRHQQVAFRAAYLITNDAAEAEDAAQDAFVKAFYALDRFRDGAPFRPWLLRIVANEARNRRRTAGRQTSLIQRAGHEQPLIPGSVDHPSRDAGTGACRARPARRR